MLESLQSSERRFRSLIVAGQARGVWIRSERTAGAWHNALVFRREGKLSSAGEVVVGTSWHEPPEEALRSAEALGDAELLGYYRRALRPRPPI
ncbi:MAG: hypothetical protein ABFS34_11105 [Gemmatimonadota bacterium]